MVKDIEGHLFVIGGAEDKEGKCTILRRFVTLAGGSQAVIAVVTAATELQGEVGQQYEMLFNRLGAGKVHLLHVANREQANDSEKIALVGSATGVYFTGGDQLRITGIVGGTALDDELKKVSRRGAVIAGTSAGASVMSDIMIVAGAGQAEPTQKSLRLAPGLGLISQVVIDQHFAQRGRIGRLLGVVAQNPYVMGLGIDEDTAIEVTTSGRFTVLGSGCVTVLDGRSLTHSTVSDTWEDEPLALTHVTLHLLPGGYWKKHLRALSCV
ncbi:MAG: Cyanophycinase [Firmicutes bacterium]|nr:Cyanophycinase [candidate division NPL-UPA2 bacterium]